MQTFTLSKKQPYEVLRSISSAPPPTCGKPRYKRHELSPRQLRELHTYSVSAESVSRSFFWRRKVLHWLLHCISVFCSGRALSISLHTAEQQTISGQESKRSTGQEKNTPITPVESVFFEPLIAPQILTVKMDSATYNRKKFFFFSLIGIKDSNMSCFVHAQAGHVHAVHAHAGMLALLMSVLHHPVMPTLCTVVFYLIFKSEMLTV